MNFIKINKKLLFKYYVILIIGSTIFGITGKYISNIIGTMLSVDLLPEMKGASRAIEFYGLVKSFFIVLIWAPIVEEIAFRLWIVYSLKKMLISLLALCSIVLLNLFVYYENYILLFFVIFLFYLASINVKNIFSSISKLNIKYRIVISGFFFGLIHLMNFELDKFPWYVCVPLILPQIFSGIFFGYIRVRNGFRYNLTLHFLINATSYLATLIA